MSAAQPSTSASTSAAIPLSARIAAFSAALAQDRIDLPVLKALAAAGVPESDPALRATVWQLLLGYLPPEKAAWDRSIRRKHTEYSHFCREFIIDPHTLGRPPVGLEAAAATALAASSSKSGASPLQRTAVTEHDHPLSTSNTSKWSAYFGDSELREQIDRDVERTHPDLNFFSGQTAAAEGHRDAMRRALFVFAKLNPGLRYVQGMNELFAVIYHTIAVGLGPEGQAPTESAGGSDEPGPCAAETASFYCFIDLLGDFKDNFCQQLDNSEVGIRATMGRLSSSLRGFDPTLSTHLETTNSINPQFFAFRWITTLLTQEFPFPDVVRLWDAILGDPTSRADCLQRLCLGMVLLVREELLKGDFAANLTLLQRYPPVDIARVLAQAERLRKFKTVIVLDDD